MTENVMSALTLHHPHRVDVCFVGQCWQSGIVARSQKADLHSFGAVTAASLDDADRFLSGRIAP